MLQNLQVKLSDKYTNTNILGGIPFNFFTKLYDSMVWSTLNYRAAIRRTSDLSCINAVQKGAIRYFLGLGKYAANAAVNGETGWVPLIVRQSRTIAKQWCRFKMIPHSVNRMIFEPAER